MEKGKLFMALFIAFIMIMSTAGFIMNRSASERTVEYNGFVLKIREEGIFAKTDFGEVRFDFLPENVEEINFSSAIASRIKNTLMVSLTSEYNTNYSDAIGYAEYRVINELKKRDTYSSIGFTEETNITKRITCADATQFVPVLFFKEGETGIYLQDNCIIMAADSEINFVRIKDRLLYSTFGIMG